MAFVPPNLYVNWVKLSLNRLLNAKLTIDGAPDLRYQTAVKSFQSYEGIKVDGIVGPQTQNRLIRANATVSPRVHGFKDYVEWVRDVLRDALKFPALGSGRAMEPVDKASIQLFQQTFGTEFGGLKDDGWVGAQTEMVMIIISGTTPPGGPPGRPPIRDDYNEHGKKEFKKENRQLKTAEIEALSWGVIGRKPGPAWFDRSEIFGTFLFAIKALFNTFGPPIDMKDINDALEKPRLAEFEIDAMKGAAYAIMDYATRTKRSQNDLKATDVYAGAPFEAKGGFEAGYGRVRRRLTSLKIGATPAWYAFEALGRVPDKRLALRQIYSALFDVYKDRGNLGSGHARHVIMTSRHCIFDYPAIKVRCGERGDIVRLDL